ncbi:putative sulfoacetate transporter SauU [Paraburkholderia humisilvae]|uniref:Putative sulfoacetate transporter SauU n=2 Tax=Paraburkholderia humisilvae TaxID=627669 RepID=A0A6J5DKN5_9BURK|nr:putative sulfoacetate transporter SauU [Paraburkholderia humisilvae]
MEQMRRWKPRTGTYVLLLICLLYLLQYSDRVNISTAASAISHDLHLSNTQLGFAFSAFAYPYAIVQLFGGWLADRFGPRRVLTLFGLIVALASMLTAFANGLVMLAAFRFLLGLGEAPSLATATSAMSRWLPAGRRGFAQGVTHACSRLGNALTPPLVALLISLWSWRAAFVFAGLAGIVWVAVWHGYFRDEPSGHRGVSPEELASLPERADEHRPQIPVRKLLRRILPLTIVDFCYAWTLWVYLTWLPSFFLHSYHLKLSDSALYTAGVFVAGIFGDTLGGVLSDRIYQRTGDLQKARRNVIVTGLAGSLVFLAPVLLVKDLTIVSASLCLAFFSMELVIAPLWAVPMDIAPRYAGTASSFMNIGFGLAGILSPLTFGYVLDLTGDWHLPFAFSIALLVVGIVVSFWMRPDRAFSDSEVIVTERAAAP